jgi:hypothetical protein
MAPVPLAICVVSENSTALWQHDLPNVAVSENLNAL